MQFSIQVGEIERQLTQCLVVGMFEGGKLTGTARLVDQITEGAISTLLDAGEMDGKDSQTALLHSVPNMTSRRLLVVGLGPEKKLKPSVYRKINFAAATRLVQIGCRDALFGLHDIDVPGMSPELKARHTVESVADAVYRFNRLKSADPVPVKLNTIELFVRLPNQRPELRRGIVQGEAISTGKALAKDLANLPGNICTPTYLANQAKALQNKYPVNTTVIAEDRMRKLGMGALLSVSRGSVEPAKLIVVRYTGGDRGTAPIALVGKGLTFDAGGISIKPAAQMDEMKYDMCGAASVLGTLVAVAEMKLPINVVGVIPSSENLPDGAANKPGDVVTSMSGQTIEILNTDAEGRLILCDALTYTMRFKPAAVIDIATLTGACVVALGKYASGLMGNDQTLIEDVLEAGEISLDRAWPLPLWEDYQPLLDSNFADMANIGGRYAGAITAGCFLARFCEDFRWAHLDIAGTAWMEGKEKGATGRVVPLLTQFLIGECE